MILADTSIWVDHLRVGNRGLIELLHADQVACHAFVIGELACGRMGNRDEVLRLLAALPRLARVEDDEALHFIERHRLMGQGLGLVDVHLLAACALSAVDLWTSDRKLAQAASRLGILA